ncbi:hypothetical protein SLA2020_317130 [Shorea laevis]
MSCNGCRVLRKGCSERCVLRSSLRWIESPEAQGNATLFLAKFFGRSDLISFISSVPESQRPALCQSLLFEACGRTVNPVNGAVGLLSSGNWHVCQAAVETVLSGGSLQPIAGILAGVWTPSSDESSSDRFRADAYTLQTLYPQSRSLMMFKENQPAPTPFDLSLSLTPESGGGKRGGAVRSYEAERWRESAASLYTEDSEITTMESGKSSGHETKVLNLFV